MGVMEFGIVRNNIYRILITNVNDLGTGIPDVDPGDIESDAYLSVDFSVYLGISVTKKVSCRMIQ